MTRALASIVGLLVACSTRPATEVIVFVDAEPGVRAATASIEVRVEGSSGRGAANFAQRELSTLASPRWPVRIALSPLDGDGQRVYRVTATALDGAMPTPALVAQVRVVSGYRPGESVRIDLLLQDACLRHAACPVDQTCVGGNCVAAMIDPAVLARLDTDAGRADGASPGDASADTTLGADAGADAGMCLATREATLLPMGSATGDQLAHSIAMSSDGSRAVLGAPGDVITRGVDAGVSPPGSARVFMRTGTTWTEEASLRRSGGAPGLFSFGNAVGLSADGSRALVAGPGDESVQVFLRTGMSWAVETTLRASDGVAGDRFGLTIALSADGVRALVGAPYDSTPAGMGTGSARVFVRAGMAWSEEATLVGAATAVGDGLGYSVALSSDGSRALVGAPYSGPMSRAGAGSVLVFLRTGTTWAHETTLLASRVAAGEHFGLAVALSSDGSRALVGAYNAHTAAGDAAGNARVFGRVGTTWTEEAILLASDGGRGDGFGYSVALSGDGSRALVTDSMFLSAYLFLRTGTTWREQPALVTSGATSVALSSDGTRAVVGLNATAFSAGSAGVFVLCAP